MHINWLKNQICVLGCMLRSHARNGHEFQTPSHRWFSAKQWDAWFWNCSKSKTRLKFMKLGMLSWSGINMPWYKFCSIWGRFGYMLITNLSFSQQAWWFSVGNIHRCGRNDIHYVLLLSIFSRVNIERQECCVNFWDFRGLLGHFYALTEFSMHLCV